MITWARERCGLTIDDLADKMKKDTGEIEMWEDGRQSPSYASLEKLAYTYLKIPLAVFYFPEPPKIDDPKKKFRRLPDAELSRLSPDTLYKIRLGQAYQESLSELLADMEPKRRIFKEINSRRYSATELAGGVRQYLGISIEKQFSFRSSEKAFKAWRHAVEETGVFSFKDTIKDKFISGFSLMHDQYPIIFINNSNAHTRQTFTLIHELGHILFGVSGVTDADESYIKYMNPQEQSLETRCNQFAAELLVPKNAFQQEVHVFHSKGFAVIPELAKKYSVSREVILRRLLEEGEVSRDDYEKLSSEWNKEYLRGKGKSGGDYYLTKIAYLGEGFTRIAFDNYKRGRLTSAQLASHLNINSANITRLEGYMR